MIHEVRGDLTTYEADFICHQTNFYGVMGGGVALAIWEKMLGRQARAQYQTHCAKKGVNLLGTVQFLPAVQRTPDGDRACVVYNLFCQANEPQADGGITRYDSMRECLEQVERLARRFSKTVALPGYMGCGIAGGDWARVRGIIEDVFGKSPVSCTIVYRDALRARAQKDTKGE